MGLAPFKCRKRGINSWVPQPATLQQDEQNATNTQVAGAFLGAATPLEQTGHAGDKGYLKFSCVKALQPKSMMLRLCPCISSQRSQMTGSSSLPAYQQLCSLAIQGEGPSRSASSLLFLLVLGQSPALAQP